jgi:uncharacterized protein (TIGR03437 family)
MRAVPLFAGLVCTVTLLAQAPPTNSSLTGKYFVRHLMFITDAGNNVSTASSIIGAMTFNGGGNYSFTGQRVVGNGTAAAFNVSGTYAMSSSAIVVLTNPQNAALSINARFGAEALVGSSTEVNGSAFDLFVAIPQPTVTQANAALAATWNATDFELTSASTAQVRDALVSMALDGSGNITAFSLQGHAANLSAGATIAQTMTGGTYTFSIDGSGSITFPLPPNGTTPLLGNTARSMQISQSGNILLGGTPGGHDILIAIKASATAVTLTGRSWLAGIRVDSAGSSESYAGSSTVIAMDASEIASKRLHESNFGTPINVTASNPYTVAADGTGSLGPSKIALGAGLNLIGANIGTALDPTGYEIFFGEAIPGITGSGVFITPGGVVNAGSNAPSGDAISPGEYVAIYGSGLAVSPQTALPPYPPSVGGVSVNIGGLPAPVYFVSAGQINCLVPYGMSGTTVTVTVNNNGKVSNAVEVPLAATSPGIFSQDGSGVGDGAIVHGSDGITLVTAAAPAKKGEIVVVYLTGLGALTAPVADGHGATGLDNATTPLQVSVAGVAVPSTDIKYAGLSSLPGLYQINFVLPKTLTVSGELPVAIATPDAFYDEVNIAVQ